MKIQAFIKPASILFCFLAAALLLAMAPASSQAANITALDSGFPPCDIGCFSPDGKSTLDDIRGATFFVGDVVQWGHAALAGNTFTVTASMTQGDYQGHTCPEPGGLNGTLTVHEDVYNHQFIVAGDCGYRDTHHPPGTGYASYPGADGVVHILPTTGPSAYWLTPVNISTAPLVSQTFTAFYADPGNNLPATNNLSDTSFTLTGTPHTETLHYNPSTNKFTLQGAGGNCSPGDSVMLSDGNLTLDCANSSVLGTGIIEQVTYTLIPQTSLSGYAYQLTISAVEMGGATRSKTPGTWIINRPPGASTCTPTNSTTSVGTQQTFVCPYSDPDGYANIAAASVYFSGNGGVINNWLHYLVAPNVFTMMGSSDVCNPGQAKVLTSGSLTLNCATSSVSVSGTNLTITFKVIPLTGGIQYNDFSGVSDQAGASFGTAPGQWNIP